MPKAFETDFIQEKKSVVGSGVTKTKLQVKYQFPSNFYLKEITNETLYICNSKNVWIYNPPFMKGEKGHLRTGASSKYCFSKIFDALSKGLKDNKLYSVKKIAKLKYEVFFKAKAKEQLGLEKLELQFKSKRREFRDISQFKLHYTGEKYPLILTPKNLKLVESFPSKVFKFHAPKNTEIQKMK